MALKTMAQNLKKKVEENAKKQSKPGTVTGTARKAAQQTTKRVTYYSSKNAGKAAGKAGTGAKKTVQAAAAKQPANAKAKRQKSAQAIVKMNQHPMAKAFPGMIQGMTGKTPAPLSRRTLEEQIGASLYGALGPFTEHYSVKNFAVPRSPLEQLHADSLAGKGNWASDIRLPSKGKDNKAKAKQIAEEGKRRLWNQKVDRQGTSEWDRKNLNQGELRQIKDARARFEAAIKAGDRAKAEKAHREAERIRFAHGYSGGAAGDQYLRPKLTQDERNALSPAGELRLTQAKMQRARATTEDEIARADARIAEIMGARGLREKPLSNADASKGWSYDGEGRRRFAGTREQREEDARPLAAALRSVGEGAVGGVAYQNQVWNRVNQDRTDSQMMNTWIDQAADYEDAKNDLAYYDSFLEKFGRAPDGMNRNVLEIRFNRAAQAKAQLDRIHRDVDSVYFDPAMAEANGWATERDETFGERMLRQAAEHQAEATEGMGGAERFLTNAAISIGQSAPAMLLAGIPGAGIPLSLASMGAMASGSKAYDLRQNGSTNDEAFLRGLVSGGIEAATEAVPVAHWVKILNGRAGRSAIRNLLKQAGEEGTEEAVSYIANWAADKAAKDPNASFSWMELLENAGMGAIGGAVFGGIGSFVGRDYVSSDVQEERAARVRGVQDGAQQIIELHNLIDSGAMSREEGLAAVSQVAEEVLGVPAAVSREEAVRIRDAADLAALADQGAMSREEARDAQSQLMEMQSLAEPVSAPRRAGSAAEVYRRGMETMAKYQDARLAKLAESTAEPETRNPFEQTVEAGMQAVEQAASAKLRAENAVRAAAEAPVSSPVMAARTMQRTSADAVEGMGNTLGTQGQALIRSAAPRSVTERTRYAGDFVRVYEAAFNGREDAPAGSLDAAQYQTAVRAGQADRAESLETGVVRARSQTKAGKPAFVYDQYARQRVTKEDAAIIGAMAKIGGLTVRFADQQDIGNVRARGVIRGKEILLSKSMIRGGSDMVAFVAGHETAHRIQDVAPEAYWALRDHVMSLEEYAAQVDRTVAAYARAKAAVSREGAMDEIVADYVGQLVADHEQVRKFIRGFKGDRSVIQRILDALREFAAKLTGRYRSEAEQGVKLLEEALRAADKAVGNLDAEASELADAEASMGLATTAAEAEQSTRYSIVTDRALLDELNRGETITVYRAMQVIDGKLYPPMAAKVKSDDGKKTLVEAQKIGGWYQSDELPELIPKKKTVKDNKTGETREQGYFILDKGDGSTPLNVAYNPYFHTSASPLNDQFSSAWKRPNLVTVECEIPKSELSSGYRAEFAKDTVGETKWHAGPVASKLKGAKARRVFLSRWAKVNRIVPDAEVARIIANTLKGEDVAVPTNVVTPSLLAELRANGVKIEEVEGKGGRFSLGPHVEETKGSKKTAEAAAKVGVLLDEETNSAAPTRYSLGSWNRSEYVQDRDAATKALAKQLKVTQKEARRFIDSINSVAKIIADPRSRLDYLASPGRSPFVSNVEYGGSIDFSTICKKRRLFTGTIDAIQRAMPDRVLMADEMLKIRAEMKKREYEVGCGLCYVEGSRVKIGKYTKEFLDGLKAEGAEYVPTLAEMNTVEGQEDIRLNHPETYEKYVKFMNKLAQRKPKLFQMATEYKREILDAFEGKEDTVKEKNKNGGLRLQSFSDFEIIHLIDSMQVIMDMSRVGLAGQAYTKQPEFAWALGDTGLKINLSLIAKGVDENGRLIFDDVEGMPSKDAMALRDRYSQNVGTVIVVFNDQQLLAALADDRIDFVLPFHRSQWNKKQYDVLGLPQGTKDYTLQQNEKYIMPVRHQNRNGKWVMERPANYMPNEYWNFRKSGKWNAEQYLKMCAENNRRPKFFKLLVNNGNGSYSLQPDGSTDGYWKLLIDFKMYDNEGKGSPQKPVRPEFNMDEAQKMLKDYEGGHENFPVAQDIVDEFVAGRRFSITPQTDADYMAAVERGDMETAQRMVDEAAEVAGYNVKVYHGTTQEMQSASRGRLTGKEYDQLEKDYADKLFPFVVFKSGIAHAGIYTATDRGVAEDFMFSFSHGGTVFDLYAKTKNPLVVDAGGKGWNNIPHDAADAVGLTPEILKGLDSYQKTRNKNNIYIDDLVEYAKGKGHDGVIVENVRETGFGDEDSPITTDVIVFDPNQVKSADPVTYDDDGNVIPLSERFDEGKQDIRYSLDNVAAFTQNGRRSDAAMDEARIRELRASIQEAEGKLEFADVDDLSEIEVKHLQSRLMKGRNELDKLIEKERSLTRKTSIQDLLDNLDDYRRTDLESLAEQISDGAWDDYEDLNDDDLRDGIREMLEERRDGMSLLEAQAAKYGFSVRPPERYSLAGGLEQARLLRENQALRDKLEYWKGQIQTTDRTKTDPKEVKRLAGKLARDFSTEMDSDEIANSLQEIYDGIGKGWSWGQAKEAAVRLAADMVEQASALEDTLYTEYQEMREYFRNTAIVLSQNDRAGIAGYNDWRKSRAGKLKLRHGSTSNVDTVFGEAADLWPEWFDETVTIHPADQLERISEVLDAVYAREAYNPYEGDLVGAAEYLATEILEDYFEVPAVKKTYADRMNDKLNRQTSKTYEAKEQGRERLQAAKDKNREMLRAEKARGKERLQAEKEKGKANLDRANLRADWLEAKAKAQARRRQDEALEKLRKKHKEKYDSALRAAREDRDARLQAQKEKYLGKEKARSQRQKERELRAKIMRHAKKLSAKLLRPTDTQHIPERLRVSVAAALDSINLASKDGKPTKRTQAFSEIQALYRDVLENGGEIVVDPALIWQIDKIIGFRDVPIENLGLDDLTTIWNTVKAIETSISTYNKMLGAAKFETISEPAFGIRDYLTGRGNRGDFRGPFRQADRLINFGMLTPEGYFLRLGESGKGIFKMIRNAQDKNIEILKQAEEATRKVIKPGRHRKLEKKKHSFDFDGQTVELTTAQIMNLYVLMGRQQAVDHIMVGGFRPDSVKKGVKDVAPPDAWRLTHDQVSEILSALTEEETRIADGLRRYIGTELTRLGNEASMEVYGYKKFREKNYWPIETDKNQVQSDVKNDAVSGTVAGWGSAKPLTPNANNAVILRSIFDVYADHVTGMAKYAAWLAPMENLNRIFNFRYKDEEGHMAGGVKTELERAFGKNGSGYWKNLMDDLNAGVKARSDNPFQALTGAYKASAIAGNIRVIVQQPTAILRALDMLNPADIVAGMALARPKKWDSTVKRYAPIAVWKDWGYFTADTGRQMRNVLFGDDNAVQRFNNFFMNNPVLSPGAADSLTWTAIWNAVESETRRKRKDLRPRTEEYYQAVADRFNDVIDHTQVVDGIPQRSQIMRSTSDVTKMATSFMSEPTKSYNMMTSAFYEARNAKGAERGKAMGRLARSALALLASFAVNAAVQSIVDAVRDDDKDEDYWEKFLQAYFGEKGETRKDQVKSFFLEGNLGAAINPATYIPFVKDILSIGQGYNVSRMDMDTISKVIREAQNVQKAMNGEGKKTVRLAWINLAAEVSRFLGMPVANLKRDILAFSRTAFTQTGNFRMQYELEKFMYDETSEKNLAEFSKLILLAERAGDDEAAQYIRQSMINAGANEEKLDKKLASLRKTAVEDSDEFRTTLSQRVDAYDTMLGENQAFRELTGEQQEKARGIVEDYAKWQAYGGQVELNENDRGSFEKMQEAEADQIDPALYAVCVTAFADMKSDKDENGKDIKGQRKQDKVIRFIQGQPDLTNAQRSALYHLEYDSDKNNPWA